MAKYLDLSLGKEPWLGPVKTLNNCGIIYVRFKAVSLPKGAF